MITFLYDNFSLWWWGKISGTTAYNDGTTAYNDRTTAYNNKPTAFNDKPTTHNKYYHIRQLWRSILNHKIVLWNWPKALIKGNQSNHCGPHASGFILNFFLSFSSFLLKLYLWDLFQMFIKYYWSLQSLLRVSGALCYFCIQLHALDLLGEQFCTTIQSNISFISWR